MDGLNLSRDSRTTFNAQGATLRQEMQELGGQLCKEMHAMEVRLINKIHSNSFLTTAVLGGLMTFFHFV